MQDKLPEGRGRNVSEQGPSRSEVILILFWVVNSNCSSGTKKRPNLGQSFLGFFAGAAGFSWFSSLFTSTHSPRRVKHPKQEIKALVNFSHLNSTVFTSKEKLFFLNF